MLAFAAGTAAQPVVDANTVCDAVVCPTYSTGSGGSATCTCDTGYTGQPIWDVTLNDYSVPTCEFVDTVAFTGCPAGCTEDQTSGAEVSTHAIPTACSS